MTDDLSALGSDEAATKVVKGRMQISLLDDTVVAFDVEVFDLITGCIG